jgi:thiosulfate/3-mercaptopyruvate sulfurtransferase
MKQQNVNLDKEIICMCGSGVTGSLLLFSLVERGLVSEDQISLYDGSWTEWASRESDGAVIENRGPRVSVSGGWLPKP